MSALPPTPGRKLMLFQTSDPVKEWWSLGETRFCVKCEHLFTGHDIRITQDADGDASIPLPDASVAMASGPTGNIRSFISSNPNDAGDMRTGVASHPQ